MNNLEILKDELKECIDCPPDITNPYNQKETIPDTRFHFAKGLLNDDTDTEKMLKEISKTGISGFDFLALCSSARNLSGADLPKGGEINYQIKKQKKGKKKYPIEHEKMKPPLIVKATDLHGRKTKADSKKALQKIIEKIDILRRSLEDEPAPQVLYEFDMTLQEMRKKVRGMVKDLETAGLRVARKLTKERFIQEIYKHFLECENAKLSASSLITITNACAGFEIDENNVKSAIDRLKVTRLD